jgi:signal transduction histidine kinase
MSEEIFSWGTQEDLQTVLDNELFRSIFDTICNGILVLKACRDVRGQITDFVYIFANSAAENFQGKKFTGEKLSVNSFGVNNPALFETLENVVSTGITENFTSPAGSREKNAWLHYTIQKLGDGVVITYEDITEQMEAEEKIRHLNKILLAKNRELESVNTELTTFGSIVSSGYKETLRHLYTLFEFIVTTDAGNLSHGGRANIRRAQSAIQKMKLLTDDIIAYSAVRTAESTIETVDLNQVVNAVLRKLEKKITETNAEIKMDGTLPKVKGNGELLSLLFYQLLDNAIKFRKEDSQPVAHFQSSLVEGMHVNHADADPAVTYSLVSISDNGIGIENSVREKIFEMFYRANDKTKYGGSGIGLSICKKIISIHNGFITAESTPEKKGTTFNCFFPLQEAHLPG